MSTARLKAELDSMDPRCPHCGERAEFQVAREVSFRVYRIDPAHSKCGGHNENYTSLGIEVGDIILDQYPQKLRARILYEFGDWLPHWEIRRAD